LSAAISVVSSFLSHIPHDNDDAACETLNWTWMLPLSVNVQFFIILFLQNTVAYFNAGEQLLFGMAVDF
jgi:hypothetical protein